MNDLDEAINARGLGNVEPSSQIDADEVAQAFPDDKVTIEKLKLLVDRLWIQRAEVEKQELVLSQLKKVESDCEWQIQCILKDSGLSRFDGSNCTVSRVEKMSVKVPKGEAMDTFKAYLRENNLENLLTVNSQTLNAWFNAERSNALGNGLDGVEIPGLEQPTSYERLAVRVKK